MRFSCNIIFLTLQFALVNYCRSQTRRKTLEITVALLELIVQSGHNTPTFIKWTSRIWPLSCYKSILMIMLAYLTVMVNFQIRKIPFVILVNRPLEYQIFLTDDLSDLTTERTALRFDKLIWTSTSAVYELTWQYECQYKLCQ